MHEAFNNCPHLKDVRRSLRTNPTRAEAEMWHGLRNRRAGGHKFRRQHSLGQYIVDFYCPEFRLAVEVDGSTHDDIAVQQNDERREYFLKENKVHVIRFTDGEALWSVDHCVEKILERIKGIQGMKDKG